MVTADEVHIEVVSASRCPQCGGNAPKQHAVSKIGLVRECEHCGLIYKYTILD